MWEKFIKRLALSVQGLGGKGVTRLTDRADDRQWFEVDPNEMYPRALAELQDAVKQRMPPSGALLLYYSAATGLNDDAWRYAYLPLDKCPDYARPYRAAALELARLWYTEKLHRTIGSAPMGLRILRDRRWKL
jgi:hypothetical protein